jgi:hypothetical protein
MKRLAERAEATRGASREHLILAEVELDQRFTADGVLGEFPVAFRAQVKTTLLVDIVVNRFTFHVFSALEQFVDLHQMIPVMLVVQVVLDVHGRAYFHPYNVPQLFAGIDLPLAAVTGIVNHGLLP